MPSTEQIDVTILGAGLSGLACAVLLTEAGLSVRVLEAAERPGGRIHSVFDPATGTALADLGPTWVWTAYQPVVGRWLKKLDLTTFAQYDAGAALLDHGPDRPPATAFLPGQDGSVRIDGGPQAFIDALVSRLPPDCLETGCQARAVDVSVDAVTITSNDGRHFESARCVVALPPRIALQSLAFAPDLPPALRTALAATPTWMAPHAKAAILYEKPFWREAGLSGRLASQTGPIVEAHDHSGPHGSPAALFGFIGWPHSVRRQVGADLNHAVQAQLKRCFGADSPDPMALHIEDWAANPLIAAPDDLSGPMAHPQVGPDVLRQPVADKRIRFAGSETARRSPGLIEGAFDAAEHAVAGLLNASKP